MIPSIILKRPLTIQDEENDQLISHALKCLEARLRYCPEKKFINSNDVCAYLRLQLAQEHDEVFAALFLNNSQELIAFEILFFGTINETPVYPRKIVKKCLEHNASKLIIAHNHPSQNCSPSSADREITQTIKDILKVIDVKIIDHFIVTHQKTFSFAEQGLL